MKKILKIQIGQSSRPWRSRRCKGVLFTAKGAEDAKNRQAYWIGTCPIAVTRQILRDLSNDKTSVSLFLCAPKKSFHHAIGTMP